MWVGRELSYAFLQKRYTGKIVPLLYHKCDHEKLHWALGSFQMVDFTADFDAGSADLLRIWRLYL